MSARATSPGAGPSSRAHSQIQVPDVRDMRTLDRARFDLSIPALGVVVEPVDVKKLKMDPTVRHLMLDIPKVVNIEDGPDGKKVIKLRVKSEDEIPADAKRLFDEQGYGFVQTEARVGYDHFNVSEILTAILPATISDVPSSYAQTGHIAHVNLRDEALPYKHIIGEVILSKNRALRTVVNKLSNIHAEYRYFDMEVIAGEDSDDAFVATVNESNCTFTLNFKQVYWNSRLHTEHERLVKLFNPGDVVADVMAGVGPFAVPAAKKGCRVLGNDLNPEGTKWMEVNRVNNKVEQALRITTIDGRAFIKSSPLNVWEKPFPPIELPKSRKQRDREAKEARREREAAAADAAPQTGSTGGIIATVVDGITNAISSLTTQSDGPAAVATPDGKAAEAPQQIKHFVMNLPDSALTFLDAYRGAYTQLEDTLGKRDGIEMPTVHVYCFTREMEREGAERDICERASTYLGYNVTPSVANYKLHLVRSVAPNKEMYCLSFRLPEDVAFARD